MLTQYRFGHSLYPKLNKDGEFEKLTQICRDYNINVEIAYEDGCLVFEYDEDEYFVRQFPGDISFYSKADDQVLFYVNETFGSVEFYSYYPSEELLLSMETDYDNKLFNQFEEKIIREAQELADKMEEEVPDEVPV